MVTQAVECVVTCVANYTASRPVCFLVKLCIKSFTRNPFSSPLSHSLQLISDPNCSQLHAVALCTYSGAKKIAGIYWDGLAVDMYYVSNNLYYHIEVNCIIHF